MRAPGLILRLGAAVLLAGVLAAGCGDNLDRADAGVDAPPPAAALSISPLTNGFGSVPVGTTSSALSFTVTNLGGSTSGQITPSITGTAAAEYAIATNGCTTLAASASCTISITFTPGILGDRAANLIVAATPGGSITAALDGTGLASGSITINPTSQSFGDEVVGSATATQTFTIANPGGTATGPLTTGLTGNDAGDFAISNDTCAGQALDHGASCTIDVAFDPQSAGSKTASLSISGTPGGTVTSSLSGTGLASANLTITPNLQDFGSVVLGQSSTDVSFAVVNTGGVATGALSQAVAGADRADFVVVSSNCAGATLAPLASCTVIMKLAPTTTGSKGATLSVTATPGGAGTATLEGTGIAAGQIAFVGPTSAAYGDVTVGQTSASQTFTIQNTGAATTGPLSTALGGTEPAQFTIVPGSNGCQGTALAPSAQCTIAIQFAPTSGGPKSASLSIMGSPGGSLSAGLSGDGIPPANLSIDRVSKDYGSVGIGETSPAQAFQITNTGGQASGALGVALDGASSSQFAIQSTNCGPALAPGASCTVNVVFAPTAAGDDSATLDLSATPGGTPSANLYGIGVTPADLVIVSGNGTFATTGLVGDPAQSNTITIKNTGMEVTGTIGIQLSGSTDFTQTSTCTTLLSGATCTITVKFAPTSTGDISGAMKISATPGAPAGITEALRGEGLPRLQIVGVNEQPDTGTFDFGKVVVNTNSPPSVDLTVINNTTSPQTVHDLALSAPLSYFMAANGCSGVTLAPSMTPGDGSGGTCDVVIGFEPTAIGAFGPQPETFDIGAGTANQATEQLTGTGVDSLQITPATNDFGKVAVGTTSPTRIYTVSSVSGAPTSGPIRASLATGPFHIVNDGCAGMALSYPATCAIQVAFTPTATGTAPAATLTVSGTPGGTVTATATGTGEPQAAVTITPATSTDFGAVFAGDTKALTFTVANTGGVDTTLDAPAVTGSDAAGSTFTRTGGSCATSGTQTLAAGATCTVIATFSPAAGDIGAATAPTGTVTATDTISGTHALTLTGTAESTISVTAAPSTDFGSVGAGQTATRTFTVTNNSAQAVMVSSIMTTSGDYTITNNTCAGAISTCTFDVVFTAPMRATATSSDPTTLLVNATNGAVALNLTATALSVAQLQLSPSTQDFGSALAGTTGVTESYTVSNTGGQASSAVTVTLSAGNFAIVSNGCDGMTLAGQGGSCTVSVQFAPPSGATTASATLTATAATGGTATATATGLVIASGGVTVSPGSADFGYVEAGSTSATQDFTVQNTSGTSSAALDVSTDGDFAIVAAGTTCGTTLSPGGSCTIQVEFAPPTGSHGPLTGHLWIQGVNTGAYANLLGHAQRPPNITYAVAPADEATFGATTVTIAYGNVTVNTTSSATITLENHTGVNSSNIVVSGLTGSDPTQFAFGSDTCQGTSLAAGESCSIVVSFVPTQASERTAGFTIVSGSDFARTVNLDGVGAPPAYLSITPTTATAARTYVGDSTPVDFEIQNVTLGTSGPLSLALGDSTDFAIDTTPFAGAGGSDVGNCDPNGTPVALAGSASCTLRVKFAPQAPTTGLSTTISVTASPGATTPITATLTGDGLSALSVDDTTPALSADQNTASTPVTLTFTNHASVATGILDTVLGGTNPDQFTIVSDECVGTTLAPAGSCQISAEFIPNRSTNASATLTVSGTPGNSATSTLMGTVTAP